MQGITNISSKGYFKSKRLIIVLLFVFSYPYLNAQDAQFSLYRSNPAYLNPSYTGSFDGNWRFAANFRNQWVGTSTPFRTATAGFDSKLHLGSQAIGMGLLFINDESGVGGLTYNKVYGALGYQFKLSENHIRIGVQPGYVFGDFNSWNNWDHNAGDFIAPSNEPNFGESVNYLDLNAGVSWQKQFNKILAEGGVSFMHVNQPNISFFDGDETQEMVSILHGGAQIELSEKLLVYPDFMMSIGSGASITALGTELIYRLTGRSQVKNLFVGAYIRNGILDELSTLSVVAGMQMNRIDIAIDYDLNIGNYSNSAGSMGAFELAIVYRSITTVLNSYSIPCERF